MAVDSSLTKSSREFFLSKNLSDESRPGRLGTLAGLILVLMVLAISIDSITGYSLTSGRESSWGQVLKTGGLALAILWVWLRNHRMGLALVLTTLVGCVWLALLAITENDLGLVVPSLSHFLKALTFLVFGSFFFLLGRERPSSGVAIFSAILAINLLVFGINVSLGYFGIGTLDYEGGGSRGLLYALNEYSSFVVIAQAVLVWFLLKSRARLLGMLLGLSVLAVSVLAGTKGAIVGSLLILLFALAARAEWKVLFALLGALILVVCLNSDLLVSSPVVQRIIHFDQRSGGIIDALLSNRLAHLQGNNSLLWIDNLLAFNLGQGGGWTAEMDAVDLFVNYGLLGFLLAAIGISLVLRRLMQLSLKNEFAKLILGVDLIVLGIALMAGHTMFSSTAGMFVGAVNGLALSGQRVSVPQSVLSKRSEA